MLVAFLTAEKFATALAEEVVSNGLNGKVTLESNVDNARATDAVARNEALRALKYLGRALWRPLLAASFGCACRAMDGAETNAEAASKPRCIV